MTARGADPDATADLIERVRSSGVGERGRWDRMARRVRRGGALSGEDAAYLSSFARIYGDSGVTPRSRMLHTRLSAEDAKPRCASCGRASEFYCVQNDAYFCGVHVVGHDSNER